MKLLVIFIMLCSICSCLKNKNLKQLQAGSESGLSMSFPDLSDSYKQALTGYQLRIEKVGTCPFETHSRIAETPFKNGEQSLNITAKVKKNCQYLIKLFLGQYDVQQKRLSAIYLTNVSGAENGTVLKVAEEDSVRARVVLKITPEGEAAGLGRSNSSISSSQDESVVDAAVERVTPSINAFSVDLLNQLFNQEQYKGKNLFVSPANVFFALTLPYIGAEGETKSVIEKTLRFSRDRAVDLRAVATVKNELLSNQQPESFQLTIADQLWINQTDQFSKDFELLAQNLFGESVERIDLSNPIAVSQSTRAINQWVRETTNQEIGSIFGERDIQVDSSAVLTSAAYFLADWLTPFPKYEFPIPKRDFNLSDGTVIKVNLMTLENPIDLNYYQDERSTMVELPYKAGGGNETIQYSMLLMVPKPTAQLAKLNQLIDQAYIANAVNAMKKELVSVTMPKFEIRSSAIDLSNTLAAMGMDVAFLRYNSANPTGVGADFSGINGQRTIKLSNVVHKAFVKVDQKGVGPATTTTGFADPSETRPTNYKRFVADKPFVYFIRERRTGVIVFAGVLQNPQKS